MKSWVFIAPLILCISCSTSPQPTNYTLFRPKARYVDHYHETLGLIESHKKLTTCSPIQSLVKPLSRCVLSPIHSPVSKINRNRKTPLHTTKSNGSSHVKFYLPASLKTTVQKLYEKGELVIQVLSQPRDLLAECKHIILKEGDEVSDGLFELSAHTPKKSLGPAQSVYVRLLLGKSRQFEVPKSAVYKNSFGTYVFVTAKSGRLLKQMVNIARETEDSYYIKEGLFPNDRIAIQN